MATADQVKARRILISVAAILVGAYGALVGIRMGSTSAAEIVVSFVAVAILVPFVIRSRRKSAAQAEAMRRLPPPTPKTYR
jgi:hypothetical protein